MDFIESCRKFISLDSTPSAGNKALAEYAALLCSEIGLDVEIMEETRGDQPQANIIARPKYQGQVEDFLLQTHLDTPDPGPFGFWKKTDHNPFDAHVIDGKIYGLGSADVKLDFLCKLEAIRQVLSEKNSDLPIIWKRVPTLVGTYGEELGMTGALKLIRRNKIKAKYALIGDSSNLNLITAAKGLAAVEIQIPFSEDEKKYRAEHNLMESTSTQSKIFKGKAAHSSSPHLGESAIGKMFEYLTHLPEDMVIMEVDGGVNFNTVPANAFLELEFLSSHSEPMIQKLTKIYRVICELQDEFLQYQDEGFAPPYTTLNVGTIRTMKDFVLITGNCRTTPRVDIELYKKWMQKLSEACASVSAEFRITDYKQPFQTNLNSEFVSTCISEIKKLNLHATCETQSSTNESSLFSRVGVECICFGPGKREGNVHTPDEHVSLRDLEIATAFYKQIILRYCL